METVDEQFKLIELSLNQLRAMLGLVAKNEYCGLVADGLRESVVQRFEFSSEMFWKFLRSYLYNVMGISPEELISPRSTIKIAHRYNIITPNELSACMLIIEDRNKSSHIYSELVARAIANNAINHHAVMERIIQRVWKQKLAA